MRILLALVLAPSMLAAQLGTVRFPNSGNAAAQADFLKGVALLHSFVYDQAAESFRAAAAADPSFALPHWFEALTHRHPLWSEEDLTAARAALARFGPDAATRLAKATDPKERGYGAAIEALFANADEPVRARAFADSMRHLAVRFPSDLETTAFASLAIMGAAGFVPPEQRGMRLTEAESLATRVYAAEPNHPGGAHYVIHSTDDPNRASRGLVAARAYAKIAPAAEHAQHMPSHIFVQLGMWDDAVQSNEHAWKASREEVAGQHRNTVDFHDLNWLQYVYLQQGRYKAARALLDTARLVLTGAKLDDFEHPDARFAICDLAFRYASETGDWSTWTANTARDAATNDPQLPPPTATPRARQFAARCVYQRAAAAAMLGDTAATSRFVRTLRDTLRSMTPNSTNATVTNFRIAQLEGLIARARRNRSRTISRLEAAASLEETLSNIGPPGALPTFELLGDAFLADTQFAKAADAYRRALERGQNRSAALLGLARARAKLGDREAASSAYSKLAANWHAADADLSALNEVRGGAATSQARAPASVGEVLPRWTPGTLDIHQISTGRGNASLIVLPDGTTLLVDAGAAGDGIPETDPHPDASRSPGDWIARYIKRHMPDSTAALDYAIITHFHPDHFGQVTAKSPASAKGTYRLSGITEVGDAIPIRTLIDRGWPSYDFPAPFTDSTMANYRRFLDAQRARGMTVASFIAGSRTQIRPRRDTAAYPNVEIRNIIGNGRVWSGTGELWRDLFVAPSGLAQEDWPSENMCSLGFRLTYGSFKYFTGGDLPGTADPGFPSWHSVEPAIAALIGPVEVHAVGQHGSIGQETDAFLRTLASKVLIIPSWAPSHPAPDVLKRILNGRLPPVPRLVFATDMRDAAKTVIGARANQLSAPTGHVVVRVDPGGTRYRVFVLSNKDESDAVLAMKGPFDVTRTP